MKPWPACGLDMPQPVITDPVALPRGRTNRMRVVAARFSEPSQASAARDLLERAVDHASLEVAPLGHPGEEISGDAVLAGRFPDEAAPAAVAIVERAGGEVVVDIDERWTGASGSVTADGGGAYFR